MSDFSVSLTGGKKTLEEGIGTGGGYVAFNQPQNNNIFDADPKRKIGLSEVSVFCTPQSQFG